MSHQPRNAGAPESADFIDTQRILFELWKRDNIHREGLPYYEHLERKARRAAWDPNPPCPDCGGYGHFECNGSGYA